jgi:hypothetical protein
VVRFAPRVPNDGNHYPGHAGETVDFVAIVCYPTSPGNNDPSYTLPGTGDVIPHMQAPGATPKLITINEYVAVLTNGGHVDPLPPDKPMSLPFIVYSHGLTGSPISQGYVTVLVALAAQGFVVAAPFHGDPRFSRVRVQDLSDFFYLLTNFDHVVEMELMRPLSLKAMTDVLLADPGFSPAIDVERIGGFGASLGGEAMTLLLGARMTTSLGLECSDPVHDPRIKAAVGYVPFGGYSFLPAFCDGQSGAAGVNKPYLAISGTADTTAPLTTMRQAMNRFGSSRYMVELVDGQHELRPEDVGDLFTWMVTFLNAYLNAGKDPAMRSFIHMNSVTGGRDDSLTVDVHVPFPTSDGDVVVREFYNTIINHYIVTPDAAEIDAIARGDAGAGWQATGHAFKAWPQMPSSLFTGVAPVCRFRQPFRSAESSAFFTADASECEQVKVSRGWSYIGTGFYILPAVAVSPPCPDGYLGVNRAYNNGAVRNDSGHRLTTSDSEMRALQTQGWTYEGAVMCARP